MANDGYTVAMAVTDWLDYGLTNRETATRDKYRMLCEKHVVPLLGARKLRDLKATEVDAWLTKLSTTLSTRTLQDIRSRLNRSVRRAMARDRVRRNVVELSEIPRGLAGRPSKALTAGQADGVLNDTAPDRLHHYIVVSLLTGARTEELRALRWEHVHLDGLPDAVPAVPPFLEVWRSCGWAVTPRRASRADAGAAGPVRRGAAQQRVQQAADQLAAGARWHETGSCSPRGRRVRRDFRRALALVPGVDPDEWTPRELRHSFVSVLSDAGCRRGDLAPGRSQRHQRHRAGLPAPAAAGHPERRDSDGLPFPGHRSARVVTQMVTQVPQRARGGRPVCPLTWRFTVGVTGFEPATSSSRTKRATKLRHTP